jgi:hypothetical protein
MEQIVEHGYVGDDYAIRFSRIVKVEPRVEKWTNPFTGKVKTRKMPAGKWERPEVLATASAIVSHAEAAQEYRVLVSSTSRPRRSLLELGSYGKDGHWHPWTGEYCLDVDIQVRNALVQVSSGSDPMNEDAVDCDAAGLCCHPESKENISVPMAGCAMAWIRVTPGKFLYPQLKDGSLELLDTRAVDIVRQLYAGEFVQACEWG